jgi:hypothetical protein
LVEVLRFVVAPLIAAVIAAVLTTYLGAHFSFRRFRKEQWWHEKRKAYDSIITQLSRIKFDAERKMEDLETGGAFMPPKRPEREKAISWSLQEVASAGAYIVTEKTAKEVTKVLSAMSYYDTEDFHGDLVRESKAAEKALVEIRAEAHRDLKIVDRPRGRWLQRLWKS